MPGESAHARLVKSAAAPRVVCAGVIVRDGIGTAKDRIKSALSGTQTAEQRQNIPL
jgi:hypothetical protein